MSPPTTATSGVPAPDGATSGVPAPDTSSTAEPNVAPDHAAGGRVGRDPDGGLSRSDGAAKGNVRRWAIWVGIVLVLMLVITYLTGLSGSSGKPLDPDNPGPEGMQALAQVLGDQGVEVEVVRGVSNLPAQSARGSTVLIANTDFLSEDSGREMQAYARAAASVVVLSPGANVSQVLGVDVETTATTTVTPMSPECDSGLWDSADRVTYGEILIDVDPSVARAQATTCLPPSPGYNAGGSRSGYLVEFAADSGQPPTSIAGIATSLTNAHITEEANAATGLRLLGGTDRLVWIIPSIGDAGESAPVSLLDVLPKPVAPSALLLLLALLAWTLVRGRRLGNVTTEPLPVVIHAIETTVSRGRLYQEANDRRRALASLQLAARRRIASRIGLPRTATPPEIVQALAQATGRHTEELHRLLVDSAVDDDATLVQIARDVRSLEERITTA